MNYNWDWGVFFKSTGIGSEIYLDWFVTGLGWTIAIALIGWLIALALGSLLGVMRTVPNRWISGIATCYVEVFRNVPLLVQLFLWYFLVPDLLPEPLEMWFKQDLAPATSASACFWATRPGNRAFRTLSTTGRRALAACGLSLSSSPICHCRRSRSR